MPCIDTTGSFLTLGQKDENVVLRLKARAEEAGSPKSELYTEAAESVQELLTALRLADSQAQSGNSALFDLYQNLNRFRKTPK